jgi:two-component system nitrate/nitrite sensor histidine kinase NarX
VGVLETHAQPEVHPVVAHAVDQALLRERTRWAMHIHDGLTQAVTSAILEIQTLRHRIVADPETAISTLEGLEAELRRDLSAIRELLFELEEGDVHADPHFGTFVEELVQRWKLPARVSVEGDLSLVSGPALETAHAIVSEALANAAKHSGSPDVAVRVRATERELRIEIEDRGRGIAEADDVDPHFGLRMMRTRAEQLGGSVEIGSTPGHGTRVVAVLPVGG